MAACLTGPSPLTTHASTDGRRVAEAGRAVTDPRAHVTFDDSGLSPSDSLVPGAPAQPLAHPRVAIGSGSQRQTAARAPDSSPGTQAVEVLGFAQSGEVSSGGWRTDLQFGVLTTVAYFGVNLNGDGSLVTADAGYQTWRSSQATDLINTAHNHGDRVVLTVKCFDDASIADVSNTEDHRQAAIGNIVTEVQGRGADGVNVDFEGFGSSLAPSFVVFIKELHDAMHARIPRASYLTVDTYASAASGGTMYDIANLAPSVDAFDVMAYDITSPGSRTAGPVAPLNGMRYAVTNTVKDYLAKVDASQIILGIPYYGYKWSTLAPACCAPGPQATTSGAASADTYSDVYADFNCARQLTQLYDGTFASPWATWWSPPSNDPCGGNHNAWRELYYENTQSLSAKYDLVNQHQLRGIGIWALGYDSGHDELWNLIASKLRSYPLTPSAPTNVNAVSSAPNSATITWQPPEFPIGTQFPVQQYQLSAYDAHRQVVAQTNVDGGQRSYTFTSLQNSAPYYFAVTAVNGSGAGPAAESYSVTPGSGTSPPASSSAVSSASTQYLLPNSDGTTWQDLDGRALAFVYTPAISGTAIVTANADLWTRTPGYNADLAISVNGSVVAWKEAGGGAAFSPNAATVQAAVPMSAGTGYLLKLQWKSNRPGLDSTIVAGAGSEGAFSPTHLQVDPTVALASVTTPVTTQDLLSDSDGASWQPLDSTLQTTITPPDDQTLLLSANADLWTRSAGYNQDLGIAVDGAVVAWKEGGGAFTYSPNAAFVQAVYAVKANTTHTVSVVWKSNRSAPGATIVAGAGSIGAFSSSRLMVAAASQVRQLATTADVQLHLPHSDGSSWSSLGVLTTSLSLSGAQTEEISGSADLWTMTPGVNVDIGIVVDGALVAWKEAGGAASYSPCAAFVVSTMTIAGGNHTVSLVWKTNRAAPGATAVSGAGSSGNFSPTTLTLIASR